MKRVKAVCICQTLHFMLKEDVEHSYAVKLVQEEVAHYRATTERNKTKYRIHDFRYLLVMISNSNRGPSFGRRAPNIQMVRYGISFPSVWPIKRGKSRDSGPESRSYRQSGSRNW